MYYLFFTTLAHAKRFSKIPFLFKIKWCNCWLNVKRNSVSSFCACFARGIVVELFYNSVFFQDCKKREQKARRFVEAFCRDNATRPKEYCRMDCTKKYFIFITRNIYNCITIFADYLYLFVAKNRCFEKNSSVVFLCFPSDIHTCYGSIVLLVLYRF